MLLHYDLTCAPGEFTPGVVEVVDEVGKTVVSQVEVTAKHRDGSIKSCRMSFYAELPKGGQFAYTVRRAEHPVRYATGLAASEKGKGIEITSETAGVRIPATGGEKFTAKPVAASQVPSPILAYRLANGQWAGKGWLESDRLVTGWSQQVVADGPLYKEYAYEVTYAPAGYYRVRVRVEAEEPLVYVAEEYDMHAATAGKDCFVLSLNDGWKPDTALWSADRLPAGKQALVRDRRTENDTCVWREALDFTADRRHSQLYPCLDWGGKSQWYGIFNETDANSPFAGIMTLHSGAWRLPDQSLSPILWTKDGQVLVKFRTSINLNGAPQNPFSTAEIDTCLPQTLGRRMWALVLGPRPGMLKNGKTLDYTRLDFYRNYYGFVNLNDYKDWTLTWDAQYHPGPRVFGSPEQLARLKANLDKCPGKDQIKDYALVTGNVKTATRNGQEADWTLANHFDFSLQYFWSHYRQTQTDYDPLFLADSALACKELPAELRQSLLAKVAANCYLLSNADFNPRGAGVHLGNPNMPINRYMSLPCFVALIPDHPHAKKWLDEAYDYTKWKVSYNVTSAGGTFRENPGYATYGPTNFMGIAAIVLRNAGYPIDRFEPLKDIGRYFEAIDTPPTPARGQYRQLIVDWLHGRKVRVLPGFGNGPDVPGGMTYMLLANLTAKSDPAFASRMMTDWMEAGQYQGSSDLMQPYYWLFWDPAIAPAPVKRTDSLLAGFGGILRDHADSPEETYVALRQGYTQSHWNPDQGCFVLYARGACLAPPTGWGYSGTAGICHDSRICFGTPLADHEHGRVDTNVEDYGFTPAVGYLLGRQTFKARWDPTKTLTNDFQWSRQVLMLRSEKVTDPSYVVVRDSTQGSCPLSSWWYQWLTAAQDKVTAKPGGVHVEAADGVKLDVTFVEPANPQVTIKGTKVGGFSEDYAQISVTQGPEKGYLTVFYPYKAGEPTPQNIERLADGLLRIVTPLSTDYVFCAVEKPVVFRDALVDINAFAGAVRIFPDHVVLVNASGLQGSVGYKGVTATGIGPFEQQCAVNPTKAQIVDAGRRLWRTPIMLPKTSIKLSRDGNVVGGAIPEKSQPGKTYYVAQYGRGKLDDDSFYVIGEAPYVVTHEPGKVTIVTEGRRRILQMPIPEDIVPANLLPPKASLPDDFKLNWSVGGWINWPWAVTVKVDGIPYQGGWYDGLMTVGIPEGKHTVEITPYTNPPAWNNDAYTRMLTVK